MRSIKNQKFISDVKNSTNANDNIYRDGLKHLRTWVLLLFFHVLSMIAMKKIYAHIWRQRKAWYQLFHGIIA